MLPSSNELIFTNSGVSGESHKYGEITDCFGGIRLASPIGKPEAGTFYSSIKILSLIFIKNSPLYKTDNLSGKLVRSSL